jgi:hypothetical protein
MPCPSVCREALFQKSPLGIEPYKSFIEDRLHDIKRAIREYSEANMQINIEWIKEYNEICDRLSKENR